MNVAAQILAYISSESEPKRSEMLELHRVMLQLMPNCTLWFLDGRDSHNRVVANPNIGYGNHVIKYADGTSKDFYQIGISANKTGISIYIFGIADKTYLPRTYAEKIGKAKVTGYCIKFKTLKEIHVEILQEAIRFAIEEENQS